MEATMKRYTAQTIQTYDPYCGFKAIKTGSVVLVEEWDNSAVLCLYDEQGAIVGTIIRGDEFNRHFKKTETKPRTGGAE
jgi:hypothetical protein